MGGGERGEKKNENATRGGVLKEGLCIRGEEDMNRGLEGKESVLDGISPNVRGVGKGRGDRGGVGENPDVKRGTKKRGER